MAYGEPRRTELTDGDAGRWVVTTQTSRYLLDLDAHETTRMPGGGAPGRYGWDSGPPVVASLRRDGQAVALRSLAQCRLGEPLVLVLDLRGDGVATVRQSTAVMTIEPVPAAGGGTGSA